MAGSVVQVQCLCRPNKQERSTYLAQDAVVVLYSSQRTQLVLDSDNIQLTGDMLALSGLHSASLDSLAKLKLWLW